MMPPIYRLLGLRYLFQRWDRAVLIVASIALGVATLVSTRILNQCLESAAADSATPLGVGDLLVTNGEFGVHRTVADDITAADVPGVKSVQPLVVERVYLPGLGNKAAVLVGAELSTQILTADNPLGVAFTRTLEITWSNAWVAVNRRLVVLSKPVFDDWAAARTVDTDPIMLRYGSRDIECQPIGYIEYADDSPVAALGRNVVGMEIGQAAADGPARPPGRGRRAGRRVGVGRRLGHGVSRRASTGSTWSSNPGPTSSVSRAMSGRWSATGRRSARPRPRTRPARRSSAGFRSGSPSARPGRWWSACSSSTTPCR